VFCTLKGGLALQSEPLFPALTSTVILRVMNISSSKWCKVKSLVMELYLLQIQSAVFSCLEVHTMYSGLV
jgi:hypothetical protein